MKSRHEIDHRTRQEPPTRTSRLSLRTFGSMKLGIVLLSLLAVAMAAATVYESTHSAQQARAVVYHTFWFNALLAVLAGNILCATILRWPFRLRQIGFILTHFAILLILGGAVVTMWFGTEGTLRFAEGMTVDHFFGDEIAVSIEELDADHSHPIEVVLPVRSSHPARGIGQAFPLGDTDLRLEPLAFYPHCQWTERHVAAESGHPAIELVLSGGAHGGQAWLHAAPGANDIMVFGQMQIRLVEVRDAATLTQHLNTGDDGDAAMGKGVVTVSSNGGPGARIDVDQSLGTPVDVPGTQATITVVRYVPHATVGPKGGGLVSRSDRPVNPAIVLNIDGPAGSEQRILFARFPEMGDFHRRGNHWPDVQTQYRAPNENRQNQTLAFLAGPDDQIHYTYSDADGSRQSGRVTLGDAVVPARLGVSLAVGQYLPKARVIGEPQPLAIDKKTSQVVPALNVMVAGPADARTTWLRWGQPTTVRVGDRSMRLVLGNRRQALPFAITLEKFEEEKYPGLQRAAMWRSHVNVSDPTQGLTLHRVIQMNEPLRYAGYTLFQSSFDLSGRRAISVLTVSRDPGKWVVYGGFGLLIVGTALIVITRRIFRARPAE